MAITSGFFNSLNGDRLYNAEQMSEYFKGIISDGVAENIGGALQVLSGSGMTVNVQSGRAFIDCRWLENNAVESITINPSHATLKRYTAVVIRLDYSNRIMSITTKDGTPATTPTKPSMTRNEQIYEMCLAYVLVEAGATSISQSKITDTRANKNLCGWVTGVIEQVDTTTLFNQWEAAYNENIGEMESWEDTQKAAFEEWLSTLTEQLTVGAYIREFKKNVTLASGASRVITLDWSNYTYETTDVFFVTLNGLNAEESADYTLNTSATPPTITVNCNGVDDVVDIKVLKTVLGIPS